MNLVQSAKVRARGIFRAPVAYAFRRLEPYRAKRVTRELAFCAIFRDEAPFLDEWISFHLGVGGAHFYLYNNFSRDNFRAVLDPWIARGVVTLIEWPVPVGQLSAYGDCVDRARYRCKWVAFIDIDEFLFSPLMTDIRPILRGLSDLPGIDVWQLFFGSAGHMARPCTPVTESYLMRAQPSLTTVKTIANPRFVYKVGIHQFKYWGAEALDTSRRKVLTGREPVLDRLRINHYWSRSVEDLEVKIGRGDASTPNQRQKEWHLNFERSLNVERDETILPVARAIRQPGN
jgi:hypothetical protein